MTPTPTPVSGQDESAQRIYQVKSLLHPNFWLDTDWQSYEWNKENKQEVRIVYASVAAPAPASDPYMEVFGISGTAPASEQQATTASASNHAIADRLSLWLSSSLDDHLRQDEYRKHIRAWLDFDGNGDSLRATAPSHKAAVPLDWMACAQIADVPAVDEALRNFNEDATADNATGIVVAVVAALADKGAQS